MDKVELRIVKSIIGNMSQFAKLKNKPDERLNVELVTVFVSQGTTCKQIKKLSQDLTLTYVLRKQFYIVLFAT